MNPRHFRYEEADGVATVRLDRPERLNALTFESYAELRDAFATLRERASVRAVIVTGTGRAFCSGGDVNDIIGKLFGVSDAELLAFTRMTCDLIGNMRALEKPIVAALNGTTCGAGAVIAAAADLRIAAESAKIAFLFTKVGLSGADMGAAWLLPRYLGSGKNSTVGRTIQAPVQRAQGTVCMSNLQQIRAGITMAQQGEERFPASLRDLRLPQEMLACPDSKQAYVYDPNTGRVGCPYPPHQRY